MKRNSLFQNAAFALGVLIALSPVSAIAQRGVEFGYKDRIFEQKYVLPTDFSALDARGVWGMAALLASGGVKLIDDRLIEAAGGACAYGLLLAPPEAGTPAQVAIDRMPKVKIADDPNVLSRTPASPAERCLVQLILFRDAMEDSLSMDQQLDRLARHMRRQYAAEWLFPSEIADPMVRKGTIRFKRLTERVQRLDERGIAVPSDLGVSAKPIGWRDGIQALKDDAAYAKVDAALTTVEDEAARALLEQQERKKAEEQRAEEEKRAQEERRRAEEEARQAERRQREEEERQAALRREEESRARRLPPVPAPQAMPQVGYPSASARTPANDTPRQEAARQAQIRQLESRRAEVDRTISRLQGQMASRQGAFLRNPLNPQAALSGIAGISQVQAELDQAKAERLEVDRALTRLRKARPVVAANVPVPVPATMGTDCREGAACPVISATLFCRTPQQMTVVLSQRPGPGRRQVRDAFIAAGDCRQLAQGETVTWAAPVAIVTPQGEGPAELVPVTLSDGSTGVLLKDGILPRAASR
ncbi:hypothetical protein [Xanthobacter pseudotagetidis]|uniref:hypothetical protein n=1 Tax=Xanthobacter pseudotagetidis TaxID=3119911 RepID=UPI003726BE8A